MISIKKQRERDARRKFSSLKFKQDRLNAETFAKSTHFITKHMILFINKKERQ